MDANFWNQRYGIEDFAYGTAPNDFLREQSRRIPKGSVLCLAEGEGRNAVFLASLGLEVTAVDFSEEGVRKTERLARERKVSLRAVHADLASWEPEREDFSGIVAIFAHLDPAVRAKVHAWVPGRLRNGGVFLLEAYRPAQIANGTGGPRDSALTMTLEGLKAELAPLSFEIGREVDRDIQEGAFHAGRSATVQVLAIRAGAAPLST